jgi:hypothetical protein
MFLLKLIFPNANKFIENENFFKSKFIFFLIFFRKSGQNVVNIFLKKSRHSTNSVKIIPPDASVEF